MWHKNVFKFLKFSGTNLSWGGQALVQKRGQVSDGGGGIGKIVAGWGDPPVPPRKKTLGLALATRLVKFALSRKSLWQCTVYMVYAGAVSTLVTAVSAAIICYHDLVTQLIIDYTATTWALSHLLNVLIFPGVFSQWSVKTRQHMGCQGWRIQRHEFCHSQLLNWHNHSILLEWNLSQSVCVECWNSERFVINFNYFDLIDL